jgi:hypothetical protein
LLVALVASLTIAVPRIAAADEAAAVNKVTQLNKKAIDAYNKQDYDTARAVLKEALELCASAGLDKHAIRARTHIHFGIVAIVGFKQREVGLKQFRKALEVQPDIKLTKQLATPELQDAFEEAVLASNEAGGGGAAAAGGEPGEGEGGGGGPVADDEGDGEKKPTVRKPAPRKKKGEEEEGDTVEGQKGVFFLGLTGGTGFGLIKGSGELDPAVHKLDAPGFAMAQAAQVSPEVGFFISPDLLLSVQLRIQFVTGLNGKADRPGGGNCGPDNFCSPGNSAFAGFAKVTYLLGSAPFHFTVGGQVGGGNIRHALVFPDNTCKASASETQSQSCVDTLAGGPFLIGPTAGLLYEIGETLNLILAVNTALGVPNFTYNFDVSAGLGFRL